MAYQLRLAIEEDLLWLKRFLSVGYAIGGSDDTSVTGALVLLLGAIPKIIGFGIILVVGWFIAGLIAKGLAVVLRRIDFNNMAERSGFSGFVDSMGIRCDASGFLGETAKWFVRLQREAS